MDIPTVIGSLRTNDEDFSRLVLSSNGGFDPSRSFDPMDRATPSNVLDLIDAIKGNLTIQFVSLDYFFVLNLPIEALRLLFDAISSLPRLQEFSAFSRELDCWSIPLDLVTNLIGTASNLTSITLSSMALVGNDFDFANFEQVLQNNSHLKRFCLRGAVLVGTTVPLDDILRSLSSSLTIESIEVTSMDPDAESTQTLFSVSNLICEGPTSLKTLTLAGWDLDDDLVLDIFKRLERNKTLRTISLTNSNIGDNLASSIANMLRKNTSLEKIDLSHNVFSEIGCLEILHALALNSNIKELGLFGDFNVPRTDLITLLQQNYVLEDAVIGSQWDSEVHFLCSLNRAGRGKLLTMEDCSPSQWVEELVSQQRQEVCSDLMKLNSVFYFFKEKPTILVR